MKEVNKTYIGGVNLYPDKTEQIREWEIKFDKLEVETWGTSRLKDYIKNLLAEQKQEEYMRGREDAFLEATNIITTEILNKMK